LDIHGSDIATQLRHEIRSRLKAGESPDAIEASLVARYGEKMRAVPDRVPLDKMGGIGWLGVALAAGFIGLVLWRWRQRGVAHASGLAGPGEMPRKSGSEASEASDDQLESELHRLDDI
jgi:cytochrome c-type biogenesis protein CcmH